MHSDVGGQYADHRLSDIALGWMAEEAVAAGLSVDAEQIREAWSAYRSERHCRPRTQSRARSTATAGYWALAGLGWKARSLTAADVLHPSVQQRIDGTAGSREALPAQDRTG